MTVRSAALLGDAVGRVRDEAHGVVEGLTADELARRPGPDANHIGWLVWHLTRVQDGHVSELLDAPQLYVSEGFAEALGLPPDPDDWGYGHTSAQVAAVRIEEVAPLLDYHDAVAQRSLALLADLDDDDLDRVVDRSWDPPVTAGVRWVSIVSDCLQHVGQAAYVRGLLGR